VILDPGLKVQIGEDVTDAQPGDEFMVPAERTHRIISTGPAGRVLEVAYGYTTEDDTHRLEDDYGRQARARMVSPRPHEQRHGGACGGAPRTSISALRQHRSRHGGRAGVLPRTSIRAS